MSGPKWDRDAIKRLRRSDRTLSSLRDAVRRADAELDSEDSVPSSPEPYVSSVADLRKELTRDATAARSAARVKNVKRARELHGEGLTPGQIAVRMTHERCEPQRPAIDPRSVSRWLADKET